MNVIDRWEEVEALFHAALESPPEQREAFLTSACSDPDLLAAVRNLLMEDAKSGGVLGSSSSGFTRLLDELAPDLGKAALLGSTIGPYKILEVLGHGGMGEVYLAEDTRLGRKVALKFLSTSLVGRGDTLRRFILEARATSALNHPNIVTIHDVGQVESVAYIAVEYIEGQTLRRRMEQPLTLADAVKISVQVARALAAAHDSGVIHRDIKPENIMIRNDGLVKVVDFGLAKVQRSELFKAGLSSSTVDAPGTVPGAIMGTVFYMSPEQATGQESDARTDLFSLGVVMYEMLAGRKPFRGDTLPAFLDSLMREDPEPIAIAADTADGGIEAILRRALAKPRDQRYQTADELLADLDQALTEINAAADDVPRSPQPDAMRLGAFWRSGLAGESAISFPARHVRRVRLPRSKRARLMSAAIASLLALATAAVLLNVRLRKIPKPGLLQNGARIERLTNSGDIRLTAISSDKQLLAFTTLNEKGASLWIRGISTGVERRILGPGRYSFLGLTFSPEGSEVYYAADDTYPSGALFRVPTAGGGSPIKVRDDVQKRISFSPDGRQFALVSNSAHSLVIANRDDGAERTVATVGENERLFAPAWSPDGTTIAAGISASPGDNQRLAAVAIDSGSVSHVGSGQWVRVTDEAWLQDGSALIMSAADRESQSLQLWLITYPQGITRRITNDTNDYYGIAIAADGTSVISGQSVVSSDIWVMNPRQQNTAQRIPSVSRNSALVHVAWAADGRIVYTAGPRDRSDLWIMDSDGEGQQQLTSASGLKLFPSTSSDNRYIVFSLGEGVTTGIWRMDMDGSNLVELSPPRGRFYRPRCSPDGKWVVYEAWLDGVPTLWKSSIDGGEPVQLTGYPAWESIVSPDNTRIACMVGDQHSPDLALVPFGGGAPERVVRLPNDQGIYAWRWSPREGLTFVIYDRQKAPNIYRFELHGREPEQLTFFSNVQRISSYDWSPDGRLVLSRTGEARDLVQITEAG